MEPPTEPLSTVGAPPAAKPPDPPPDAAAHPFAGTTYLFASGVTRREMAPVRDTQGRVILTYRGFASAAGPVATVLSVIVVLAGVATALFLLSERLPLRGLATFLLTLGFGLLIATFVPRANVTLFDDQDRPSLTISQLRVFPSSRWVVTNPDGVPLATLRKTHISRLGRNRWAIDNDGRYLGEAVEEGWGRAWMRKVAGKFSRRFECDVVIRSGALVAGRIHRRPDGNPLDRLEIAGDVIERRVSVALATLILGREP